MAKKVSISVKVKVVAPKPRFTFIYWHNMDGFDFIECTYVSYLHAPWSWEMDNSTLCTL